MSGHCGVVSFDGSPVGREVVCGMAQAAAHRGTGGVGYWVGEGVGLAYLSWEESSGQPRVEGELAVVADARVDNRGELVGLLRARGERVGEESGDAELILAAYRCWGEGCAARIVGDFAFVIWDGARRRLFAARDPMAMRALYYRVEPRRVLWATEVKQILAVPGVPARLFEPAVAAHLTGPFGRPEWTFYEGVQQLAPAHALVVQAGGAEGRSRVWRYWEIDPGHRIEYRDEEEYGEHFLELFKEAVRCRLRGGGPVGVFLSGGLDSGSIASTAGWLMEREGGYPPFRAYCWAFEELQQCDERAISDGIARRYGFPVTYVAADECWPLRDYPAHGPDKDEPFLGVYQPLIERTLELARSQGMRLMLSGDRGDLTMGEYIYDYTGLFWRGRWPTLFRELRMWARSRRVSLGTALRRHLVKPLRASLWHPDRAEWLREPARRAYRRLRPLRPRYPPWLRPEFAERAGLAEPGRQVRPPAGLAGEARRLRYQSIFTPMHVRGMLWSERTYARFGLGFADPWSDRRIASFAMAVPQRVLNRTGEDKRLTRRGMRQIMPEEVRSEARKITPYPLFRRALEERARHTITQLITNSESAGRGYIDEGPLRAHYDAVRTGAPEHPCFWWALTLEAWLRQHGS